ncbi:MAG: hypothetical protein ABI142_05315 [Bryocella sp.]
MHGETLKANPQRAEDSGLHLVQKVPRRWSPLALWHLLSLDAPTVAAVWTIFAARSMHVNLPWTSAVAMFVAVWMLYAADRLLDARMSTGTLEVRHHFHERHRRAFLVGIVIGTMALAWLLPALMPAALRLYALMGVLLVTYFFLIHVARPGAKRLPKEFAVGIFFPAAVFIPTVARVPALQRALLPEALLFAAVCTLNCLFVYSWEHLPPYKLAHWTTRLALRKLPFVTALVAAVALLLAVERHSAVAVAVGASALLLLTLETSRRRLSMTHLRAAADLALLTPLLLPAFWR